jgi:hypothetical protein
MTTQTTIKLSDIDLDVFQLPDGSYAGEGLFRLLDTSIYRYQDCWYWVSPDGLPAFEEYTHLDYRRDGYLSFDGNRLACLHFNSIEPGRDVCEEDVEFHYVPVTKYIDSVIDFCVLGELLSDEVIDQLRYMADHCNSSSALTRLSAQSILLRDTLQHLRLLGDSK